MNSSLNDKLKDVDKRFSKQFPEEPSKIGGWEKFVLTPEPIDIRMFYHTEIKKLLREVMGYIVPDQEEIPNGGWTTSGGRSPGGWEISRDVNSELRNARIEGSNSCIYKIQSNIKSYLGEK